MARFKNQQWDLQQTADGRAASWDVLHAALMMDIRDELQKLNTLLHCSNFIGIPRTLKLIDKRLAKKVPLR